MFKIFHCSSSSVRTFGAVSLCSNSLTAFRVVFVHLELCPCALILSLLSEWCSYHWSCVLVLLFFYCFPSGVRGLELCLVLEIVRTAVRCVRTTCISVCTALNRSIPTPGRVNTCSSCMFAQAEHYFWSTLDQPKMLLRDPTLCHSCTGVHRNRLGLNITSRVVQPQICSYTEDRVVLPHTVPISLQIVWFLQLCSCFYHFRSLRTPSRSAHNLSDRVVRPIIS